jgi:2-oxoglutarate ferredoxin oxidoreductase subunit alpha
VTGVQTCALPIFLTDQYLVDSYYNVPKFNLSNLKVEHKFIKTKSDYKRYQFTESGISPRGIPNYGEGVVRVDSDEHDEMGHITEDLEFIRPEMVNKRLFKKMETMKNYYLGPEMIGPVDPEILVICWGSNYHIVNEAIQNLNNQSIGMLHYSQVYPLHSKTNALLSKAKKVLSIENNATAQFANIIQLYGNYTIKPENKILKYNGAPFSVEEIMNAIKLRGDLI